MTDHLLGLEMADNVTTVCVGDRIVVRLPESPTTGYRWSVDSCSAEILSFETTSFEPSDAATPGASGWRTFCFAAVGQGEGGLRLVRRRPPATTAERIGFTIAVGTGGSGKVADDELGRPR